MPNFNLPYRLACLYMGMTEEYDRSLTDIRSRYDPTEAFLYYNDMCSESNRYANAVRKKIIEDYCVPWKKIKFVDIIVGTPHSIGLMNMKGFGSNGIFKGINNCYQQI